MLTHTGTGGWIASASATDTYGDAPTRAIDGDATTRWASDEAQSPGLWFQVNMILPRHINAISLDAETSAGDYPHAYLVFVSLDGTNWGRASPVALTTARVPAHTCVITR